MSAGTQTLRARIQRRREGAQSVSPIFLRCFSRSRDHRTRALAIDADRLRRRGEIGPRRIVDRYAARESLLARRAFDIPRRLDRLTDLSRWRCFDELDEARRLVRDAAAGIINSRCDENR